MDPCSVANHSTHTPASRKEFFAVSLHNLKATIGGLGIEVRITMKAEAREYRETEAIVLKQRAAESNAAARV